MRQHPSALTRCFLLSLFACSASGCVASSPVGDDEVSQPKAQELVGGIATSLRGEIGQVGIDIVGGSKWCTATLVDPRYVITAAHCINYTSGPKTGVFNYADSRGAKLSARVERGYALGRKVGAEDVAFVRLARDVTDATPAVLARVAPQLGSFQTVFGYGCQNRTTKTGGGFKQMIEFVVGATTQQLCSGDSGGPVVIGRATELGPIYLVNSGSSGETGADMFGDVIGHGRPGLAAVRAFGNNVVTNNYLTEFAGWAAQFGVRAVSGDFNKDGLTDVALAGGAGWRTLPVAFSNGDGTFRVTNFNIGDFGIWAGSAKMVAGDFNGDGYTDLALAGGSGWTTLPVAFSNGDGTFGVTNFPGGDFARWAGESGAKLLAGDFDGDGDADLALTGPSSWHTIPVAFSNRTGTFNVTNLHHDNFPAWAGQGAQVVAGDFDGDGDADLALAGVSTWSTLPVAFSNRNGSFSITNVSNPQLASWAANGVKIVAADFDGDGDADLGMVGGPRWITSAFALSNRNGDFTAANLAMTDFPAWAGQARYALVGRFDRDAQWDIALTGGSGWQTLPVAFLRR